MHLRLGSPQGETRVLNGAMVPCPLKTAPENMGTKVRFSRAHLLRQAMPTLRISRPTTRASDEMISKAGPVTATANRFILQGSNDRLISTRVYKAQLNTD